jgi:ABC-type transport system substrate-binding protein
MRGFCSWEAATKENKWSGRNSTRWQSKGYDDTFKAATVELDPVRRAALLIKCNDLVVNDQVVIPVVSRPDVAAVKKQAHGGTQRLGQQHVGSCKLVHRELRSVSQGGWHWDTG